MLTPLTIDPNSSTPKYLQISEQLKSMIIRGELEPRYRLPTVRALASSLKVAELTVFKAYSKLQLGGLIQSQVGRGTTVCYRLPRTVGAQLLQTALSQGPYNTFETISHDIGIRSLASAVPDPELFHSDDFFAELNELRGADPWLFYYAPPAGCAELLTQIAHLLESWGIIATEDEIVVTEGSTNGLYVALATLTSPGDTVVMEEPNRLGLREVLDSLGLSSVSMNGNRSDLGRAKVAIVAPTFGASTGLVWSEDERRDFLGLATEHGWTVLEDGALNALSYLPGPLPATLAQLSIGGPVIFVGSFSYMLAPGIRIGFLHAARPVAEKLAKTRQAMSRSGNQLLQLALASFMQRGKLQAHLRRVVPKYRSRRDALMRALELRMPMGTEWTRPLGGLSTWVTLREGDYGSLHSDAVRQGVAVAPGAFLSSSPDAARCIRLSFGIQPPEGIHQAIATLGRIIDRGS